MANLSRYGQWPRSCHPHNGVSAMISPELDKVEDLHSEHEHLPRPRGIAADQEPSDLYDYFMTQLDRWQDRRFPKVRS